MTEVETMNTRYCFVTYPSVASGTVQYAIGSEYPIDVC